MFRSLKVWFVTPKRAIWPRCLFVACAFLLLPVIFEWCKGKWKFYGTCRKFHEKWQATNIKFNDFAALLLDGCGTVCPFWLAGDNELLFSQHQIPKMARFYKKMMLCASTSFSPQFIKLNWNKTEEGFWRVDFLLDLRNSLLENNC